eukprot:m.36644 g.36644  ORF g.36644 m.36644 type:complete len:313 (+) comp7601_c0_seq1:2399-3337(+)
MACSLKMRSSSARRFSASARRSSCAARSAASCSILFCSAFSASLRLAASTQSSGTSSTDAAFLSAPSASLWASTASAAWRSVAAARVLSPLPAPAPRRVTERTSCMCITSLSTPDFFGARWLPDAFDPPLEPFFFAVVFRAEDDGDPGAAFDFVERLVLSEVLPFSVAPFGAVDFDDRLIFLRKLGGESNFFFGAVAFFLVGAFSGSPDASHKTTSVISIKSPWSGFAWKKRVPSASQPSQSPTGSSSSTPQIPASSTKYLRIPGPKSATFTCFPTCFVNRSRFFVLAISPGISPRVRIIRAPSAHDHWSIQ